MKPKFFSSSMEFRTWLEKNHKKEKELLVGYYKKSSGRQSINWPESVDQALCFGWIDGIRKSIDNASYSIRFTPRKIKSTWSAVNINKVEELKKLGLMTSAGLEAYNRREDKNTKIYSFEQRVVKLNSGYEKIFRKNKKAWEFFQSAAPSYKKPAAHWVMSARQEETRLRRLNILIKDSAAGEKIKLLRRKAK